MEGLEVVGVPRLLLWLVVDLKVVLSCHLSHLWAWPDTPPQSLEYKCAALWIFLWGESSFLLVDCQPVTAVIFQCMSLFLERICWNLVLAQFKQRYGRFWQCLEYLLSLTLETNPTEDHLTNLEM